MPGLSVYKNRNALVYFALSAPALALQALFIVTIVGRSTSVPGAFQIVSIVLEAVPWAVIAASIFAVVTFRSSLLLSLLVLSYFMTAVLTGGASLAAGGLLIGSGETAALVVAASFCSLIGFGYSRAARIEKGRKAVVSSSGTLPFQALGILLEFFFPALVAIGLVVVTILVVGSLRAETMQFPPPLSSVFSNFIVSPIATIIVAALSLTVVKNLVEPWILYYTLTKEDAVQIMQKEALQMETRRGIFARLASGSLLFSAVVIVLLLAIILLAFGSHSLLSNLGPVFRAGTPTPEPNAIVRFDNAYIEFKDILNTVMHLLWG